MELKERISLIIRENSLKQKDLALTLGVTESYISTLLSGRNQNISISVAKLIEEKLGYNSQWVLTGKDPKYKQISKLTNISDIHRKAIFQIEKMSNNQVKAVIAFMDSLSAIEKFLLEENNEQ